MRPESTNGAGGTSGGGLAVPMAWLCAEYLADEVLRAAALVAPGSLEYRAGLQALALTVHLAEEPDGPSGGWAAGRIDEWLRHTAYDRPWPPWVEDRLAGARSGDKGGDANIGVWVRTDEEWRWLAHTLTVARLRELLPETAGLDVTRHVLPNLRALNFTVAGILGDGVASQARFDPQAKALGEWLRSRHTDIPAALLPDVAEDFR